MRIRLYFLFLAVVVLSYNSKSQDAFAFYTDDSIQKIDEIVITDKKNKNNIESGYLKSVENFGIYAGKKTDVINADALNAVKARSVGRQIYGKVAGLNILESDASGLQLDIATRGLDPSRSASFNIRQNGYDMSADALGYPDAYYTPPTDALDRIEIVRGSASLQYGTQFGGLINFKLKDGSDIKTPYQITLQQTGGLYGYFNSFNSIGGTYKKINYYSFYQFKRGDSWRPNGHFKAHNAYFSLDYNINDKMKLNVQYSYMNYLAQQSGGLTDLQFNTDPKQSRRTRNFFKVNWNLLALNYQYKITPKSQISTQFFGLIAGRDAIGNLNNIQQNDVPNTYRTLFKDKYKNFGNETKWMYKYKTTDKTSFVALLGARIYRGFTTKLQEDHADSTSAAVFASHYPDLQKGSDYKFPSLNASLFGEHLFTIGKFSITPGFRYEYIVTQADGKYRNLTIFNGTVIADTTIFENRDRKRHVFLGGLGLSYKPTNFIEVFANISQNYRAINFNDIRITRPGLKVDENIQDEKGFSFDFGIRGTYKNILNFNTNFYYLVYNNRISEVMTVDSLTYSIYRYRTNIAKSRAIGIDISTEVDFLRINENSNDDYSLKWYSNFAFLNAKYVKTHNKGILNKFVEYAPSFIYRTGLTFAYKSFQTTFSANYVSKQYSDATNAIDATANAIVGIIPAYYVLDFSASYDIKWFTLKASINNLSNNKYFTRRTTGYPGPGIIPAEPINFLATLIFTFPK